SKKTQGPPEKLKKKRPAAEKEAESTRPSKKKKKTPLAGSPGKQPRSPEETPSTTQEKIDDLEKNEAKTTARHLQDIVRRTVVLEKKLEEHHDYVRLNSQPTELTINEEQMEPEKIEDYNDKKILDELATVNRNLKKTRHEIFVMNHRIEEERKNTNPRSRQKVENMRNEKLDEAQRSTRIASSQGKQQLDQDASLGTEEIIIQPLHQS
ncbi:unnamed protein product, partial [Heligmosomoides polygyrus]|uniref:Coiled-coil domain-containing protein 12 n=1 Tax=Heligmosomoides polygyrus TaxID=6339 RepID=A0A183G0S5_HELPZ